jgi:L-threonine-O-3-phosphate decarboxylase
MSPEPRAEMAAVEPVAHGAVGAAELAPYGLAPSDVIDFSVNTNPLGPSLAVLEELRQVDPWRYPDSTAAPLRRALAESLSLDPEQIVAGNGSSELIWLLALAYARPAPEAVLIVGPTFGEYARACRLLGAAVHQICAGWETAFQPDVAALAGHIRRQRPRLVWLCNPNNPTGVSLRRREVETLLDACVVAGTLLVVDEAYLGFVRQPDSLVDLVASGHLFLLRSLTKDYALAGLRLGYGVATPAIAAVLRTAQPPWSVNAAAQACGVASLGATDHLERARQEVWTARVELVAGLERLGYAVVPPAANFLLVEVGDAPAFRARLLPHGLVVRDCTSFGLPRHVRIGVRTQAECGRLLSVLLEALSQ